jgi:23S rRNA pseudouridine1911/1915/1917 synthase
MEKEFNNIVYTSAVDESYQGIRIDKYIATDCKQFSRAQVQRLINAGFVYCDDEVISDNDFKTRLNDVYQITEPAPQEASPIAENIPLDILYEDEHLIVVNKPAGMTVHPAPGAYSGTLVNALLYHCRDSLSGIGGVARPGIVHRIDKNTSGILVVAKNDLAHNGLAEQFYKHSIERTYFAITYNIPQPLKGKIEGNIARSTFDRKKMALVKSGGKHAVTHYETIENYNNAIALVKCNLETGRTHQIRVHLSSIGCHLVGDDVYKGKKSNLKIHDDSKNQVLTFSRQALHAYSLGFVHPISKKYLEFSSDFPDDMKILINILRKHKL